MIWWLWVSIWIGIIVVLILMLMLLFAFSLTFSAWCELERGWFGIFTKRYYLGTEPSVEKVWQIHKKEIIINIKNKFKTDNIFPLEIITDDVGGSSDLTHVSYVVGLKCKVVKKYLNCYFENGQNIYAHFKRGDIEEAENTYLKCPFCNQEFVYINNKKEYGCGKCKKNFFVSHHYDINMEGPENPHHFKFFEMKYGKRRFIGEQEGERNE